MADTPGTGAFIRRGTAEYRKANVALFLAGFSTFALLYSVQPLLPILAGEFGLTAGQSSLSLSVATGALAWSLLAASWAADAWRRKTVMLAALLASSVLSLTVAVAPTWTGILVARTLVGLTLSGVPAVAMAYLGEEVDPRASGFAMGLYIGGNAIGGMTGRLLVGVVADLTSWRTALGLIGSVSLASALAFAVLLPPSRHFRPGALGLRTFAGRLGGIFGDPGLPWLFAASFLLMGSFVTVYNYIGFRLAAPPYNLSHSAIAAIFVTYLVGSVSSAVVGSLGERFGRRKLLWATIAIFAAGVALTTAAALPLIITGIVVLTFGFFGAHSIASSWVTRRTRHGKAQASSLYLFFYYMGSSVIGTLGGVFWNGLGWWGVAALVACTLALALLVSVRLFFLEPLPVAAAPH